MLKKVSITIIVLFGFALMAFNTGLNDNVDEVSKDLFYEPIVVLELFTSQGCSSCPAADLLLEKSKKENQNKVYALSYHVDYWNYIGWEDPFSNASYAKKQRKYNTKFRNRSNYTPQLVINGKEHFVGSDKNKIAKAIRRYSAVKTDNYLKICDVKSSGDTVAFNYEVDGVLANKNIRTLLVLDERTTLVKRGENRNRTLKNNNIVVAEKIEYLDQESQSISMVIPTIVRSDEKISLIVLVEDVNYTIVAAAKEVVARI